MFIISCNDKNNSQKESALNSWTLYVYEYKFGEFSKEFNNKIEFKIIDEGKHISIRVFGEKNNLTHEVICDTNYKISNPLKYDFRFNDIMNAMDIKEFNEKGEMIKGTKPIFNDKGKLIALETYSGKVILPPKSTH